MDRQEYSSGLPYPPPGDLPNPGIEIVSLKSPAIAGEKVWGGGGGVVTLRAPRCGGSDNSNFMPLLWL